jgi:hypothetical protein
MKNAANFFPKIFLSALPLLCLPGMGVETNEFFAMDTIARGRPPVVVPLLKELGYSGLGGAVGDGEMAIALKAAGLRYYNGYLTLSFDAEKPALDDKLRQQIEAMKGHNAALWLAVDKVRKNNQSYPNSSADADDTVVAKVREIAAFAESRAVKIALYPHTATWLEKVEVATRIADKINSPAVGITFNLCHWLKVEGNEIDPMPVLKAALPRLMFLTINGADGGDTRAMGWDRLIQPLGQGSYDVAAFVKGVRALGYKGPVGFQGYGIQTAPQEVLKKSMEAWKGF